MASPITMVGITASQSHRRAEVGRDLWRSSGPSLLLQEGHQAPIAQVRCESELELIGASVYIRQDLQLSAIKGS